MQFGVFSSLHFRPSFRTFRFYGIMPNAKNRTKNDLEICVKKLGDLSFENTKEAYKSKSNWHLWRALFVWKICSYPSIVERNMQLMGLGRKMLGTKFFEKFMKATFYGHFVAGDDENDAKPVVQRLKNCGIQSILTYSVEADIGDQEGGAAVATRAQQDFYQNNQRDELPFETNAEIFRRCVRAVRDFTGGTGLSVVKMTSLGRPQLLLRASELIVKYEGVFGQLLGMPLENLMGLRLTEEEFFRQIEQSSSSKSLTANRRNELSNLFRKLVRHGGGTLDMSEWGRLLERGLHVDTFLEWLDPKSKKLDFSYIEPLTSVEKVEFRNLVERLDSLAAYAAENNVRMMVDAEQTYLQPAISRLTFELMRRYNRNKTVIFNTYQAYLKSTWNTISSDLRVSRREGFCFAAKLVRGAYMVQERKRAETMGYEDPINPSIEITSQMYHKVFMQILEEAKERPIGEVFVLCATHNEESVRRLIEALRQWPEEGCGPIGRVMCFGQLYGMCDQVSFSLGQAGFPVFKYLPYGPVLQVLPYLSRRLQENGGGFLGKSDRERALIWRELKRRYKALHFVHRPAPLAAIL